MSKAKPAAAPSKSRSLSDFRAVHDRSVIVPSKIKGALAELAKGGPDNWEYESEFAKRAGLGNSDISTYRDQFTDHIVQPRGRGLSARRVWVATAKGAAKFREVVSG